jgi:uncharacterized protein YjiS (DUF1127 family)
MRYERPWQGDAIATRVCARLDREDGIIEGFGGGSGFQVDRRAQRPDVEPAPLKEHIRPWEGTRPWGPVSGGYPGHGNATQDCAFAEPAETPQNDAAGRPGWGFAITLMLGALWSSIRRRREMHRIEADWATIDDRTLQDIGVSRYGLERVRDPRHWT